MSRRLKYCPTLDWVQSLSSQASCPGIRQAAEVLRFWDFWGFEVFPIPAKGKFGPLQSPASRITRLLLWHLYRIYISQFCFSESSNQDRKVSLEGCLTTAKERCGPSPAGWRGPPRWVYSIFVCSYKVNNLIINALSPGGAFHQGGGGHAWTEKGGGVSLLLINGSNRALNIPMFYSKSNHPAITNHNCHHHHRLSAELFSSQLTQSPGRYLLKIFKKNHPLGKKYSNFEY